MVVLQEVKTTVRVWRPAPGPAAIALLSIALSVGATAVVFTAIQRVLLRPLPYTNPSSLVLLGSYYPKLAA